MHACTGDNIFGHIIIAIARPQDPGILRCHQDVEDGENVITLCFKALVDKDHDMHFSEKLPTSPLAE